MRAPVTLAVVALGFACLAWPHHSRAQPERDFVFTDLDGHLVIRFAGTGATGLDTSQMDEISNAEFSRMVHDRLRADLLFAQEPRDPVWAQSMEPQIEAHVKHAGPEFSDIYAECHALSCRVILEQDAHWDVTAHREVLETVQESIEAFIEARPQIFERVFMITAYYQEDETSHIKAFLRRSKHGP